MTEVVGGIDYARLRERELGELAARLGSIRTFDQRGEVIFLEDFESTLNKWFVRVVGVGGAAHISNEKAKSRAFSCKLITGPALNNSIELTRILPQPVPTRLGFECSVLILPTVSYRIDFYCNMFTGTHLHQGIIQHVQPGNAWNYINHTGWWTAFSMPALKLSSFAFNTVKLVMDLKTQRYVRFIANNAVFDMSALPYWHTPNAAEASMEAGIMFLGGSPAGARVIYLDDVILTQNEP